MADFDQMKDQAADAFKNVEGKAEEALQGVQDSGLADKLKDAASEAQEAFKDATDGDDSTDPMEHVKNLGDKAKDLAGEGGEEAKGIFNKIKDAISGDK